MKCAKWLNCSIMKRPIRATQNKQTCLALTYQIRPDMQLWQIEKLCYYIKFIDNFTPVGKKSTILFLVLFFTLSLINSRAFSGSEEKFALKIKTNLCLFIYPLKAWTDFLLIREWYKQLVHNYLNKDHYLMAIAFIEYLSSLM